jgi:hypothetical protein
VRVLVRKTSRSTLRWLAASTKEPAAETQIRSGSEWFGQHLSRKSAISLRIRHSLKDFLTSRIKSYNIELIAKDGLEYGTIGEYELNS